MATLGSRHEGKWPNLTNEELKNELPHGGVAWNQKTVELTDTARERITAAINTQAPIIKVESEPTVWGEAFNSWSTYKTQ